MKPQKFWRNNVKFCLKWSGIGTYLGPATRPSSSTAANTRVVRFRFPWAIHFLRSAKSWKVPFVLASVVLLTINDWGYLWNFILSDKILRWTTVKQREIGDPDKIWATNHGRRTTEVRIREEFTRGSIRKEFHRRRESGGKSVCGCGRESRKPAVALPGWTRQPRARRQPAWGRWEFIYLFFFGNLFYCDFFFQRKININN